MTAATEDRLAVPTGTMQPGTTRSGTAQPGTAQPGTAQSGTVQSLPGPAHAVQTHRIFIRATPLEIWDALTRPGWTQQYGYRAPAQYEMRPGGAYRAFASVTMQMHGICGVVIDGEVLEADPPRRLVQTWHVLFDAGTRAEAGTRLTWEIEEGDSGVSTLTLTHDLADAPNTAALVEGRHAAAGGGWAWILSDLKTLLETGKNFAE